MVDLFRRRKHLVKLSGPFALALDHDTKLLWFKFTTRSYRKWMPLKLGNTRYVHEQYTRRAIHQHRVFGEIEFDGVTRKDTSRD